MDSSADKKVAEYRRLAQDTRAKANKILLWNVREKLLAKARQWEAWAEVAERQPGKVLKETGEPMPDGGQIEDRNR